MEEKLARVAQVGTHRETARTPLGREARTFLSASPEANSERFGNFMVLSKALADNNSRAPFHRSPGSSPTGGPRKRCPGRAVGGIRIAVLGQGQFHVDTFLPLFSPLLDRDQMKGL